jgi:hypothetical protein
MIQPNTYVYGDTHSFRLLAEFSLTEMKVEVRDKTGAHAIPAADLTNFKEFKIDGCIWRILWQRQESDERGPYVAVGLSCRDGWKRIPK